MLPKHSAHNTHNPTLSLLRAKTSAFHPSYYRKWRLQARPGQAKNLQMDFKTSAPTQYHF